MTLKDFYFHYFLYWNSLFFNSIEDKLTKAKGSTKNSNSGGVFFTLGPTLFYDYSSFHSNFYSRFFQ